jgi:hypothetical protein
MGKLVILNFKPFFSSKNRPKIEKEYPGHEKCGIFTKKKWKIKCGPLNNV